MRRPLTAVLLPTALLAIFLGHLANSDALLATRDIPIFHLPLRSALLQAAETGLPTWNPGIHGGQPILSNPNYAAFYPATWLMLFVPVHYSIGLVILLHGALAFAGARRFATHLGCSEGPALFAGLGFTFSGAALATTSLLTTFCGLAWMPWILYGCDRWLASDGDRWLSRTAVFPAAAFALQILAGEPVIVLTTGLAAAAPALFTRQRPVLRAGRLALICGLAVMLAAVQLVPTLQRIEDTQRAQGLDLDKVLTWSTHPYRMVETISPRAWGDPMRIDEDLYFGWSLHDRQFPYLLSIYPGQLVLLFAIGSVLLWRVRHRFAWLAMIAAGVLLATGAHNPLFPLLGKFVPFLSQIRYPEKFLLLATSALVFAAALGWQRVLDARNEERSALEDFPLALAAFFTLLNFVLLALLWLRPDVGEWFARTHSPIPLNPDLQLRALSFFRLELVAAIFVSFSSLTVMALHRWRRVPTRVLVPLTLVVLVADLYYYNHSLTPTVPAAEVLEPPPALHAVDADSGRIFTERSIVGPPPVIFRTSRPGPATVWDQVENVEPYLANLWGFPYAVHGDFDLMATGAARSALSSLQASWRDRETVQRILGAWSVRHLVSSRPLDEILQDRLDGIDNGQISVSDNPLYRERYRFEETVVLHGQESDALEADRKSGYLTSHWISPPGAPRPEPAYSDAEVLEITESPAHIRLAYRADGGVPLTLAHSYHSGWRAGIDGRATTVYRTSLGMMGLFLPAGEHVLELRFREPATLPSLLISLLTIAGLVVSGVLASRRVSKAE